MPESWQEKYALRFYETGPECWLLGTKIEAPLPEGLGELLDDPHAETMAETFYYYLLQDLFRETAEWCGHMSSVVRRI